MANRGRNLACWCKSDQPCHADILLQLANGGPRSLAPHHPPRPFWQCEATTIFNGDSLRLLQCLEPGSVDVVCTDPPYSSGGMVRGDRMQKTSEKYVLTGTAIQRPEFHGDNRDQRSFVYWCTLWMAECLRLVKPGGIMMCFTDWRQLPAMTDAIQAAGWVWRGFVPWDKTEASRPQKGWFRTGQCEYVLLASKGPMMPEQERAGPCMPGVFRGSVKAAAKLHMTGKPVDLIRWLLSIFPAGTRVLDPFIGSGTTLVAAKELGMLSVGMELSVGNCQIAATRLQQEVIPLTAKPATSAGKAPDATQGELIGKEGGT
ncbi:MAG: DUF4326 domain-containing protein [Verrucomicrobiaceae bacterium]|nr:MAG: DUF4326 domain-containing protein [Verrucomicrobiaceae bacterium]